MFSAKNYGLFCIRTDVVLHHICTVYSLSSEHLHSVLIPQLVGKVYRNGEKSYSHDLQSFLY